MTSKNNRKKAISFIIFFYLSIPFPFIGNVYSSKTEPNLSSNKEDATTFIKDVVDKSLAIVNDNVMSDEQKRQKLSEYVNRFLDIDRIAYAVFARLGYKTLPPSDQDKVKAYLKKYLIRFYAGAGKLSAMMNSKLRSTPVAEPKGSDFAVITQFMKNSAPSIEITWVTNCQKIYYVEIEGINQLITLRSEMQAAVGSGPLMDYINKHLDK